MGNGREFLVINILEKRVRGLLVLEKEKKNLGVILYSWLYFTYPTLLSRATPDSAIIIFRFPYHRA